MITRGVIGSVGEELDGQVRSEQRDQVVVRTVGLHGDGITVGILHVPLVDGVARDPVVRDPEAELGRRDKALEVALEIHRERFVRDDEVIGELEGTVLVGVDRTADGGAGVGVDQLAVLEVVRRDLVAAERVGRPVAIRIFRDGHLERHVVHLVLLEIFARDEHRPAAEVDAVVARQDFDHTGISVEPDDELGVRAAVLVDAVFGDLDRVRIDGGVGVVAVLFARPRVHGVRGRRRGGGALVDVELLVRHAEPVAVEVQDELVQADHVRVVFVDEPVAVVVPAVADLLLAGVDACLAIVAVHRGGVPVTVAVEGQAGVVHDEREQPRVVRGEVGVEGEDELEQGHWEPLVVGGVQGHLSQKQAHHLRCPDPIV